MFEGSATMKIPSWFPALAAPKTALRFALTCVGRNVGCGASTTLPTPDDDSRGVPGPSGT